MKIHELLLVGITLLGSLAAMNYRLGRCYWRHEVVAQWVLSLISSLTIIACARSLLTVYCPELELLSPLIIIIAVLALFSMATVYRYFFSMGERSVFYVPDPNKTYDIADLDDIPPMPAKAANE